MTAMELLDELNNYKNIITNEVYDYLFSLLALENSALDEENLRPIDVNALSNLKIYKSLVAYNIISIIKEFFIGENITFTSKSDSLSVNNNGKTILSLINRQKVNIYLNTYIHNEEKRRLIIDDISKKIDKALSDEDIYKDEKNQYALYFRKKAQDNLEYYRDLLSEVNMRKSTKKSDKLEVENIVLIDKLLDELKVNYFTSSSEKVFVNEYTKKLIREYPLVKVEKNINYI